MAFFPRDERNKNPTSSKRKELAQERNRDYPNVEQGLIGAATLLEEKDKHLKWVYAAQPSRNQNGESQLRQGFVQGSHFPDVFRKRLKYGKQLDVFPSTCPIPWNAAPTSIQQRAEQGANFLRTYIPDVEIPEELIRDQLVEDTTLSRTYERFDPYLGNLLASFESQNGNGSAFLIFPTGETHRDLNFTNITYVDPYEIFFRSSNEPFYKSSTPIRQILVSNPKSSNSLSNDAVLAVRTFSSTHILGLKHLEASDNLTTTSLYAITRKDMENETAVDIRHLVSSDVVLAVGDGGTVFACDPTKGGKEMTRLHKEIDQALPSIGHFRRLALDKEPSNYFLLSSRKVQQLDMRMQSVNELYSISAGDHVFTSLEDCHHGHILRLCSTNQVIWMDTRFPRKPLLAYGHCRQHDRSLSTLTFDCGLCNRITILTSRHNSLITVYDVSQSIDGLIQLNTLPYNILPDFNMYRKIAGLQVVKLKQHLGLACLSEREGLTYNELLLTGSQSDNHFTVEMSRDMQTIRNADLRPDPGPLGIQEFSQVDLQDAYEGLFSRYFKERKELEEATAESVYEIVDSFPSYFQVKELPTEYMLTTFDVILRAGDEPDRATRADFLTESVINSKRGFRALKKGRLAPGLINAPWKKSMLPVFLKLDPEFQADHQEWMEYLQKFNLSDPGERSSWSREFEHEACEQLVMDLVFSSDIYSDLAFAKLGELDQALETMTEALSLGDKLPRVEFGYLKPVERKNIDDELEASGSEVMHLPIGVRLLLKDWDDSKVEDYVYRDPYHGVSQPPPLKTMKFAPSSHDLVVQSQHPPAILASNVTRDRLLDLSRRPMLWAQSQDHFLSKRDSATGSPSLAMTEFPSQELAVSTQVLPGPHGGRSTIKKKPAKKRLGGF